MNHDCTVLNVDLRFDPPVHNIFLYFSRSIDKHKKFARPHEGKENERRKIPLFGMRKRNF